MKLKDNNMCFVCGTKNKAGLKLNFEVKDEIIKAEFIPDKRLQGFEGIVHGGIVAAVLGLAVKEPLRALARS